MCNHNILFITIFKFIYCSRWISHWIIQIQKPLLAPNTYASPCMLHCTSHPQPPEPFPHPKPSFAAASARVFSRHFGVGPQWDALSAPTRSSGSSQPENIAVKGSRGKRVQIFQESLSYAFTTPEFADWLKEFFKNECATHWTHLTWKETTLRPKGFNDCEYFFVSPTGHKTWYSIWTFASRMASGVMPFWTNFLRKNCLMSRHE